MTLRFTITHRYCGFTKTIEGPNLWDAFKLNGLDYKIWEAVSVEKI